MFRMFFLISIIILISKVLSINYSVSFSTSVLVFCSFDSFVVFRVSTLLLRPVLSMICKQYIFISITKGSCALHVI
jgi:hypothetical protein